jgi:hypothetical protein
MLAINAHIIVIITIVGSNQKSRPITKLRIMKIEIAACLLSLALLPACSTTSQTTAGHQTMEQRLLAKYASNEATTGEPAPPAAGPQDIPAEAPSDPDNNPAMVPSPLLRYWASSRTP